MGRPPLNNKPTLIRLPSELLEKIDELVGNYGRAKFIRDAVEDAVTKAIREARRRAEPKTADAAKRSDDDLLF